MLQKARNYWPYLLLGLMVVIVGYNGILPSQNPIWTLVLLVGGTILFLYGNDKRRADEVFSKVTITPHSDVWSEPKGYPHPDSPYIRMVKNTPLGDAAIYYENFKAKPNYYLHLGGMRLTITGDLDAAKQYLDAYLFARNLG